MAQNAPGKHYREGLSLVQLTRMFPDDEKAAEWVEKLRWPEGTVCPHCGCDRITHPVKHKTMTHRCKGCRKWFSVRTGTCMESSKLGLQTWVIAVYLLNTDLKGQSSMKLHRDLGITQKSAWHLAHRIREAWEKEGGMFAGPIEVDETHIGGKRKNMPRSKRKELSGRGPVGKTTVIGAKDRASNRVVAKTVETRDTKTLHDFVGGVAAPGATVYTDDWRAYRGMPFKHEAVNHSAGEYVRGVAHTNGIEAQWSEIKRGVIGTYHHLSEKHLNRYIGEFTGRHNSRTADTLDQMASTIAGLFGKRLRYADLIADKALPEGVLS